MAAADVSSAGPRRPRPVLWQFALCGWRGVSPSRGFHNGPLVPFPLVVVVVVDVVELLQRLAACACELWEGRVSWWVEALMWS